MTKRDSNTSSLEEAIQRLLKVYKLGDKMMELDIVEAWPEVMGKMIATRTEELIVRNKVLYVKLSSSSLRQELAYGKAKIVDNINEHIGEVYLKDVVLK